MIALTPNSADERAPNAIRAPRLFLPHIDGMRALAALYVALHHALFWAGWTPKSKIVALLRYPFSFGHCAVAVFIVLSGFCLTLPIIRNPSGDGLIKFRAGRFYWRRIHRILPPFYVAAALSMIALALTIHFGGIVPADKPPMRWPISIFSHLLVIQNLFFYGLLSTNYPLWSIAVECQIYLLFPLIIFSWRKLGTVGTTLLIAAVTLPLIPPTEAAHMIGLTPHFVLLFFFGAIAAAVAYQPKDRHQKIFNAVPWLLAAVFFAGVAGATFLLFAKLKIHWYDKPDWFDLPLALAVSCLLIEAAKHPDGLLRRSLSWRPLAAIGLFSYSLYLIHMPIVEFVWPNVLMRFYVSDKLIVPLVFAVYLPATIALAYVFHICFERPFMNTSPLKHDAAIALPHLQENTASHVAPAI